MFHKGRPVKLAMYPAFSYILYPAKNPASVFGKLEDLKKRLGECTVSASVAKSRAFLAGVGAELLSAPGSYFCKEKTGVFKTNLSQKQLAIRLRS